MMNRGVSRRQGPAAARTARPAFGLLTLALFVACGLASLQSVFADSIAPEVKADDKATQEMHLRGVEDTMRASEDQRRRIEAG
jgi:hypothetical protein